MDDCIIMVTAWFCCYSCGTPSDQDIISLDVSMEHPLAWRGKGKRGKPGNAERWALESGVDLITSLPKKGGQIKIIHIYIYIYIYVWSCFLKPENMGGLHYSIPNILAANLNKSSQCYPWHGEMVHIAPPNQGSQTGSRAKWLNTVNGRHLSANLQVP